MMLGSCLKKMRKYLLGAGALLLINAGVSRAGDNEAELRSLLEQQTKQIEELKRRLDQLSPPVSDKDKTGESADAKEGEDPGKVKTDENAVKNLIADYLKEHPGAGMPSGVQTGFYNGQGFVIRSAPNPSYVKWEDDLNRIPFEMRIRGRLQMPYYFYKVTDSVNHFTGNLTNPNGIIGANSAPDFSQLEVKRMRLIFEGNVFTPDLRYHIQLDGGTRGIAGLDPRQGFFNNPIGNVQGGQADTVVDHTVRLFSAFVAYDIRGCAAEKGCGPDCPEGTFKYAPTYTLIVGKIKPLFGLEEYLGSGNEQFVEFSMANWFFDADDDNLLMAAGTQIRAFDDRFYFVGLVTNGNETQTPNLLLDRLPGINLGCWWDFGGSWNSDRNRWDLFGDSISDIDHSCNPVVRLGGAVNVVPMNRRSEYTTAELDRVRVVPGIPNAGGQLTGVLNGAGVSPSVAGIGGTSIFAVDAFDSYSYNAFIAGKFKGFSLYNEWWLRNLDNFRGERIPNTGTNRSILYTTFAPGSNTAIPAVFPANHGIVDFGTTVQAGYFVVPKKVELVARFSWISGESGNVRGDGTFRTLTAAERATLGIPTAAAGGPAAVRVVNGAFDNFQDAEEYGVGVNYFFKRQLLKWQTDFSFYNGGNPAAGGQSAAGFIPGVDGWLLRTQLQLAF